MAGRGVAPVSGVALMIALVMPGAPALAQSAGDMGSVSRPVVQALPSPAVGNLESALQRLAGNPRDITALVDAGSASIELGDTDAAIGFFSRAADLSPSDPRPKVGMGAALVRSENPYDALMMFEEAERYGASSTLLSGDRGLAWDLVGDNSQAQAFYRQALASGRNDEVTRRLALSLAISGDRREAEKVLQPLLDRNDPAARRTRAFILAISGDAKTATDIAQQSMPRDLAERISPYLRYMPRLTPAQQAAAANFGHFPNTADIGKDDPRVAKYNKEGSGKRATQSADTALVPKGEPLGGAKQLSRREQRELERRQALAAAEQKKAQAEALAASKQAELARVEAQRKAAVEAQARAAAEAQARAASEVRAREAAAAQARAAAEAEARAAAIPPAPSPALAVAAPVPAPSSAPTASVAAIPAAAVGTVPASVSTSALPAPLPGTQGGAMPASASAAAEAPRPSISLAESAPSAGPATSSPPASWSLSLQASVDRTGAAQIASFDTPAAASAPGASGELPSVAAGQPSASAGVSPAGLAPMTAPVATPAPASAAVQAAPARAPLRVADAFADLAVASSQATVAAGAVDITKIKPRREEPPKPKVEATPAAKPTPPPKPVHPSRSWVQVATGRDEQALGFDWRRLNRTKPELFKGRKAYVAKWGQTKRMVTGPFDSAKAAQDFVAKLKTAGIDSFTFTSDEGEAVEPLGN